MLFVLDLIDERNPLRLKMEKLLFPVNIIPVFLGLMVSYSVLGANNSVDFYFFGSKDDARFLFVDDEDVVLMCEAKGFLNPTFQLTLNGDELFDGNSLVAQNDRLSVDQMGSCLQLMIRKLQLSLSGEYKCLVTEMSIDSGVSFNSSLYLDVHESPQCRNNGSSNMENVFMVYLDCIHFLEDEVTWSLSLITDGNQTVKTEPAIESLLSSYTIGTNKMSTRLSQVTNDQIRSFVCSLKNRTMDMCIIENNDALFERPTISPFNTIKVSSSNCSSLVNRTQITPTNFPPTVRQTTVSTSSESSDNPNKMSPLIAIIVPIVVAILVCLLITVLLYVYFKNRNHKEQEARQDAVNHLFGGSVQVNHHPSQYVHTNASEPSGEKTHAYDSVPYTSNQDDVYDEDKTHIGPPKVSTEIPQCNPVFESAPSDEITNSYYDLQDGAPDNTDSSFDPVYEEAPSDPTKITTSKGNSGNTSKVDEGKNFSYEPDNTDSSFDPVYEEAPSDLTKIKTSKGNSGNTSKVDEGKNVSYEQVDRSDQERHSSVVYATVDRKKKKKSFETNTSNFDEKTGTSNTDPTGDVYSNSNAEMEDDAMTRL